ncbi:MAG TPA: AI-2E family transporter [Anaerolineales bacterium]|nr:AI-2E family transporter [Anaerolineales bacterium]
MRISPSEEVTTWTTGQVVLATLFVVCVFLIFWLLYSLRLVLLLFFVAIVIGTAIRPAVEWLHRRGISRAAGTIIIYVLIAGVLIGLLAIIFPLVADQATQISQNLPQYYTDLRSSLINSHNRLLQNIGARVPSQLSLFMIRSSDTADVIDQVTQTFLYTNLVLKGVLSTLAIFLLAYYWNQESNLVLRSVLRLFPPQRKKGIREFFQLAETKLGGYIRGEGLLCLLVGFAAFIAYLLIGLPYTLVLGIFAGLMEMVPIFGPALGAVPAFFVALSIAPGKAFWVVVATGVIQMLENTFLVPRVMNNALGVNPIIVLLSLIAFTSVFGFMGALLALPLAAILQLFISRVVLLTAEANLRAQNKERQIQALIGESQSLRQAIYETSNQPASQNLPESDRLELYALADELDQLLGQLNKDSETP